MNKKSGLIILAIIAIAAIAAIAYQISKGKVVYLYEQVKDKVEDIEKHNEEMKITN